MSPPIYLFSLSNKDTLVSLEGVLLSDSESSQHVDCIVAVLFTMAIKQDIAVSLQCNYDLWIMYGVIIYSWLTKTKRVDEWLSLTCISYESSLIFIYDSQNVIMINLKVFTEFWNILRAKNSVILATSTISTFGRVSRFVKEVLFMRQEGSRNIVVYFKYVMVIYKNKVKVKVKSNNCIVNFTSV